MSVAELKATPKKEVQVSKPPYFLAYILLAYPASVYEVLGNPQRFLANSTEVTRLADSGRVVAAVCLWTILIALVRFLPDSVIPRWFAVGRKGADALERYGDPLKPATMCVSELHAAAAVIIGLVLLGPDMLGLDGRTWEWCASIFAYTHWVLATPQLLFSIDCCGRVRPMDDGVASYISMFVGYQVGTSFPYRRTFRPSTPSCCSGAVVRVSDLRHILRLGWAITRAQSELSLAHSYTCSVRL
eukprot:SAG11_NODE_1983_length_3964_cov_5.135023_4_plen_244_part_00